LNYISELSFLHLPHSFGIVFTFFSLTLFCFDCRVKNTGGSCGTLLLLNGDIMGISGILSNSLRTPLETIRNSAHHWRWVWIASFALTVNLYVTYLAPERALEDERSERDADVPIASTLAHLIGGFLVGLGTKIGNGCTTGHGICGIGRLSKRSLAATVTFTGFSALSTFLTSPLRSWASVTSFLRTSKLPAISPLGGYVVSYLSALAAMIRPIDVHEETETHQNKSVGAAVSGIMFAFGLALSGMTKNSKVHDFLCVSGFRNNTFDPTLMAVMGSGILTSWISYQFVDQWSHTKPKSCLKRPAALPETSEFSVPTNGTIDWQLVSGATLFGLGWGMVGLCPGPAMFAAAAGNTSVLYAWLPAFMAGSTLGEQVKKQINKAKKL
jgi:uncharacterized membrane protein YedE/YeeE